MTREDTRGDYGERRFVTTGRLGGRIVVCVWTVRDTGPRAICLRKANEREQRRHERAEKLH